MLVKLILVLIISFLIVTNASAIFSFDEDNMLINVGDSTPTPPVEHSAGDAMGVLGLTYSGS